MILSTMGFLLCKLYCTESKFKILWLVVRAVCLFVLVAFTAHQHHSHRSCSIEDTSTSGSINDFGNISRTKRVVVDMKCWSLLVAFYGM